MALTSSNAAVVVTDSVANTTDATPSGSYTVGAGTSLLLVAVGLQENVDLTLGGVGEVSALTYNGVAMTRAARIISSANNKCAEIWRLLNPATGANTLAATLDAKTDSYEILAVEIHGAVLQSGPIGATATSEAALGNATKTVSLVSTADNSLLFAFANARSGTAGSIYTPVSGTELVDDVTGSNANEDSNYWLANLLTTTAGSYTLSATTPTATAYTMAAVEVVADIGGLSVAVGTQGHTVASPAISQINSLIAVAASQGHTATAPFVGLTVIPVSVIDGHVVASPGLAQQVTLKTVSGIQDAIVSAPGLVHSQVVRLAVGIQGHSVTAPALSQSSVLVTVSPLSGHSVAAGALLQQQALRIANAITGHTADGVRIVSFKALSVVSAITGHVVNVGMLHVLIPGQSPEERIYAVLEDGRAYQIFDRHESELILGESRTLAVNPWGEFIQ